LLEGLGMADCYTEGKNNIWSSGSGPLAHFLFPEYGVKQDPLHIGEMLEPGIRSLGYELVGVEYQTGGRGGGLLRVYIDSEDGVSADDCQKVSYQVSGVLDVEDPIKGPYTLEVSSPGLDRMLFKPEDFERFAGQQIKLRAIYPIEGRRRFKGRLLGLRESNVVIEQDGQEISLPFDQVEQARLVPEY
jgi:ribosome maturation factor RimP